MKISNVDTGTPSGFALSDYSIEKLSSADELTKLQAAWNALTEGIQDCSYFLSWGWISTWWQYLHDDHGLWLLTACLDGHLVGIVPLMCSRHQIGPLTFRKLSFIGSGLARPAHLDIVARTEEREILSAAFIRYLDAHHQDWDLLELEGLQENSSLVSRLFASAGRCLSREPIRCSFVSLPASWEVFQKESMSSKLRKTIRYYERRLQKAFPGKVVFERLSSEAALLPALKFLVENSRRQFRERGMESCFESQSFREFYENLVSSALQRGSLRFYQLRVNDEIVAVQQCFAFKGIFYGYQTAFDADMREYSPGQQLLAFLFQESIGETAREIDMMHGDTDYKSSWANGLREDAHIWYGLNRRARLGLLIMGLMDKAIIFSRHWVPKKIRQYINTRLARKIS
jgi:CelD/BcsL family acetyltransferase involved in cellulose biosynthesis